MKILHYVDENKLVWGEAWIQLIKALGRNGVQNVIVCKSGGTLEHRLAHEGIACHVFDAPVSWLPAAALGLGRIIDRVSPDIIHTRLSSAARLGGYWGRKKKIAVVQSVDKYPKARYHKKGDLLLPCSTSVKEHMESLGFPLDKLRVVFNPLQLDRYRPNAVLRAKVREDLGIGNGPLLITGAGRFIDWKGFDILLMAYSQLLSRNEALRAGSRLLLVGDGEEAEALRRLAEELDLGRNVIMPGFASDIRPYLQASDIFVLPSKKPEPFGIVLLEALASGVACIATRGGGALDMISDGSNGWLVGLDSVSQLSSALETAAGDASARRRAAAEALKSAARFDVEESVLQVTAIYQEVLAAAKKHNSLRDKLA